MQRVRGKSQGVHSGNIGYDTEGSVEIIVEEAGKRVDWAGNTSRAEGSIVTGVQTMMKMNTFSVWTVMKHESC